MQKKLTNKDLLDLHFEENEIKFNKLLKEAGCEVVEVKKGEWKFIIL